MDDGWNETDRGVERIIRRAMEEGAFDNLPGEGKPLPLDDDPFEDPDMRMAHHLLRSNGFAPLWIEERRELQADIRAAEAALARSWAYVRQAREARWAGAEWDRAVETFRQSAATLNRRIRDYNLKAPHVNFHLPLLDAETAIQRYNRP